MNKVNEQLEKVINGNGKYRPTEINLGQAVLVNDGDYNYNVRTDGNIFVLQTTDDWFECPLNEVDWKILLNNFRSVELDEKDQLVKPWQHFPVGSDRLAVFQWFEWFFEIKLTNEQKKKYVVLEHLLLPNRSFRFWSTNTNNNTHSFKGELWYKEILFTDSTEEAIKASRGNGGNIPTYRELEEYWKEEINKSKN